MGGEDGGRGPEHWLQSLGKDRVRSKTVPDQFTVNANLSISHKAPVYLRIFSHRANVLAESVNPVISQSVHGA